MTDSIKLATGLLLDGSNHGAAAELLHVVEHVVDTALPVLDQLVRVHAELVHEGVVHGIRTVLGKHQVVGRGSRLLVSITANQVLGVRGALDQVGDGVDVDELLLGDVPTVHDEVDVEPDLRDLGNLDGLLDFHVFLDDLVHDLLVVLVDAGALGQTPLAVLLAQVAGQAEGGTEDTIELVVQQPVRLGRLLNVGLAIERITDESATDVEQETDLVGKTEGVQETQVAGSVMDKARILGEAEDDTTTRIGVDVEYPVGLETVENVEQIGVRKGEDIQVAAAILDSQVLRIVFRISLRIGLNLVGTEIRRRIAGLILAAARSLLVQALERSPVHTKTDTEARGGPLGQIEVDGRDDEHLGDLLGDLPVVVTIVRLGTHTGAELPVVPETIGEHGVLLHDGGRDHATGLGRSLFHDGDGVLILTPGDFDILSENTCRRDESGRGDQNK